MHEDPTIRGRRILAFACAAVVVVFSLVGAGRSFTVYYARDLGTGDDPGITRENTQAIAGSSHSRWAPDQSKKDTVASYMMIEHATTGGVARTDGVLHLTGQNACPT